MNNIFGPFQIAKVWFHVKSEWRKNDQISTKSSLNFTFWKFLEHSDLKALRFCCNQHQKCRTDGFIKLINQENWFFIPISRKTCNVGPFEIREVNIQLPNSIYAVFSQFEKEKWLDLKYCTSHIWCPVGNYCCGSSTYNIIDSIQT